MTAFWTVALLGIVLAGAIVLWVKVDNRWYTGSLDAPIHSAGFDRRW